MKLINSINHFFVRRLCYLIHLYQRFLSPLIGNSCRFHPSCSQYCKIALLKHGLIKGSILTLARVCRCNPFFAGGFDYVPPRKKFCCQKQPAFLNKSHIS